MSESNFVDYVNMVCRSGHGGGGSTHLRREKFIDKGGPDGGDGGRGGHIILQGNHQMWTLVHLRFHRHAYAEDGRSGSKNLSSGRAGNDVIIEVPLGTVARDSETGEFLMEITKHGEKKILLQGGRGGQGNAHFKSPTMQTPRFAQPGEEGIERRVNLELKILADVGLVGFPNAGKSTLLSVVSAAKPKIADYPFTTLVPNLGIVPYYDYKSFVMADIPGIIEGAAEGKGLGLRFLRHIERNALLLFMVPADADDLTKSYEILVDELRRYNPELLDKERILAITKSDMLDDELIEAMAKDLPDVPSVFISSLTGLGIDQLKTMIWDRLQFLMEDDDAEEESTDSENA